MSTRIVIRSTTDEKAAWEKVAFDEGFRFPHTTGSISMLARRLLNIVGEDPKIKIRISKPKAPEVDEPKAGRPRLYPEDDTEHTHVRCTPAELELWSAAAARHGLTADSEGVKPLVRQLLNNFAKRREYPS